MAKRSNRTDEVKTTLEKAIETKDERETGILTVYIPLEDIDELKKMALKERSNVSQIMRELISDYLTEIGK